MKTILNRFFRDRLAGKSYLWLYLIFVIWTVITYFLMRSTLTPYFFAPSVFLFVLLPGFALTRLTKIKTSTELFDQMMIWLTVGWVFIFSCSLIGILGGLTIFGLIKLYYILSVLLFFIALIVDLFSKSGEMIEIKFKDVLSTKVLVFLLLVVVSIGTATIVGTFGADFRGDPLFHISILRKVFNGQPLWPSNLSYVKDVPLHIAYGFPIWHVSLGLIARIFNLSIFATWQQIVFPLTLMTIMVWYWLARNALPGRIAAILALFFFLILRFFQYRAGYFFMRLPVPDTLGQLFLLPLAVALALRYIFDKKQNYKLLLLTVILSIFMAAIHLTQYFYYLLIVLFLAVVYLSVKIKDKNFVSTAKKIGFFFLANVLAVAPLAIALEIKGGLISKIAKAYWDNPHIYVNSFKLFPILIALFLLFFIRQYAKVSFLVSLALMLSVLFMGSVQTLLLRMFGPIFLSRLGENIRWNFLFWGLAVTFLIILLDRLISFVSRKSKIWGILFQSIFFITVIGLIFSQFKWQILSQFYSQFLMVTALGFVTTHITLILVIVAVISLGVVYLQKYPKVQAAFSLESPKNHFSVFLAIVLAVFIVFAPNIDTFKQMKIPWKKLSKPIPSAESVSINPYFIKGGLVNFMTENIPPKSVILFQTAYFYQMAAMVDSYMVSYPNVSVLANYQLVYDPDIPINQKVQILRDTKTEYIVAIKSSSVVGESLDRYPKIFKKIYTESDSSALVYKVNVE